MSIKAEVKKKIRIYMLEHIENDDRRFLSKATTTFDISRTTAYNYIKQMLSEGIIENSPDRACKYALVSIHHQFHYDAGSFLEEDRIYNNDIAPLMSELPQNVQHIWRYVFTEMMNNAIEHSNAANISCMISQNVLYTALLICDNGVGIFRKIQLFFEEKGERISLDEAVDSLFPGKFTTAEKNHSGEGIFFSSRVADRFSIYSDNKFFSHNSFEEYKLDVDESLLEKGTIVSVRLANNSPRQIKEVFDMFADPDRGFFKTQIPVAHMFDSGYPVSRSEARRLGTYMKSFEEVCLDFKNVDYIGQAFTHELFIVFQNNNPQIQIEYVNAAENVEKMIKRVKNT